MDYRFTTELIERLHVNLDEWDLTQGELAEAVEINTTTLNQWLLGRRVAQSQRASDAVRRLCRRVGLKPEQGLEPLSSEQAA